MRFFTSTSLVVLAFITGSMAAAACNDCHGPSGQGVNAGIEVDVNLGLCKPQTVTVTATTTATITTTVTTTPTPTCLATGAECDVTNPGGCCSQTCGVQSSLGSGYYCY